VTLLGGHAEADNLQTDGIRRNPEVFVTTNDNVLKAWMIRYPFMDRQHFFGGAGETRLPSLILMMK
jgi:hypothetical protein